MDIRFYCNCGEGKALAQVIRQFIISKAVSWRPIAFKITGGSSIILDSKIIQSSANFIRDLSSLNFTSDSSKDILEVEYTFNGSLLSDDLTSGEIRCVTPGVKLLQAISDETFTIVIYYRKASGVISTEENYAFMQDYLNTERLSFPISRSVHYTVSKVFYKIKTFDTYDTVVFTINDGVDGLSEMSDAIDRLISSLSSVKSNLSVSNE